jgi:predicted CXXCH cytochrome family protein
LATTRAHQNATRLALLGLACALALFAGAAPTSADNGPHVMGAGAVADTCAACHRAHTSQSASLLEEPQAALCYTCHGGSGAGANTDVENGIGYSEAGRNGTAEALRGGGFKYALIDSANPSGQQGGKSNPNGVVPVLSAKAPVTSAHSTGSSEETAWGNGPISATVEYGTGISLRCGSCHDPHGNGNYRALRAIPKESGAGSPGVKIPDASTKAYTTENYWSVEDTNAPGFITSISAWCTTCHTRYLSSTSYTDSGDAVFTYRHRSDQTAQGSANCIQCHVAHGSNASVSESSSTDVHNPEGRSGVPAGPGSRLLRIDDKGTCQMCHAGE